MGVPASAAQQPAGAAGAESAAPGSEGPTVDSWSAKDQRIAVSQPAAGFLYDLVLRAKIDGSPGEVYNVLIDPHSHKIFRGIKATLSRTELENDGKGRRKLRIGHRALTKFLWISVTFDTELFVWEDDVARTIRFTNARSDGFMSKFDGTWHVQPFTQQTLDSIYKSNSSSSTAAGGGSSSSSMHQQPSQDKGHNWLGSILQHGRLNSSSSSSQGGGASGSLVTLNQALSPRARPPGPVAHLVRGLCGRVLHNMMEDLRAEVARRQQQQQLEEGDAGGSSSSSSLNGTRGGQSFFSGNRSSSNSSRQLPAASLTLASAGNSGWGSDWGSSSSSSSSSSNPLCAAGDALSDLMAAAVPLHITIKL